MSTKIIKAGILTRANGEEIVISDSEQETFRPSNKSIITCDGTRCAERNDADTRVTIILDDEQIRKDPDSVPDAFFRFIKVQPTPNENVVVEFCGVRCLKDYLDLEYVWPLSPREKAAQIANNAAVDARKASRFEQEPVSQADGEAA